MKPSARITLWLPVLLALCLFFCLLMGPSGFGIPDVSTPAGRAIFGLRLSRLITGFFVGAALSCAGTVFQALLRNPLAEPYVLGVSSGAGLGAAIAILGGLASGGVLALPAAAFAGAAVSLALVFVLSADSGSPSVYGLILSGVIVSAVCSSVLMFLVALSSAEGLHSVLWWMLGNLHPASIRLLAACAAAIAATVAGSWLIAPELNALTLGREAAHYAGVRTGVVAALGLGLATLMTASAVAVAGLIGFVGLIVPHVVRALTGPDHRRLIPAAAVAGGVFLALCDAVARTALRAQEIPVGVVTALCGGPFFLAVLRKRRRQGWIG